MKNTKEQRILFWLAAIGLLAIIITTAIQLSSSDGLKIDGDKNLEITEQDRIKGPVNAKVTIVEYSDFECPFCQKSAEFMDQLLVDFPNDVRIVYRYLPLTSIHRNAYPAALAAEAAGAQGKFWEMHDMLFAKTNEWPNSSNPSGVFQGYAEELGLDVEKFKNDTLNKTGKDKIEADIASANILRLKGTPSIFANGESLKNSSNYQDLKDQVQAYVQ